jgi:hypothetical protein
MTNLGQQSDPRSLDAANKAQGQRTRKRAAIFMIAASLSAGFILGRASAWLLPWGVDGQQSKVNATAGRQRMRRMPPRIGSGELGCVAGIITRRGCVHRETRHAERCVSRDPNEGRGCPTLGIALNTDVAADRDRSTSCYGPQSWKREC